MSRSRHGQTQKILDSSMAQSERAGGRAGGLKGLFVGGVDIRIFELRVGFRDFFLVITPLI